MKEINMTKAISCMPDKFITMEMVELAATEHRPELVNYLPEKYITSEILDSIFKTDLSSTYKCNFLGADNKQ